MTLVDHGRRVVVTSLVVLGLLLVPSMALAQFSSRTSASLSVGTDRLTTPSAVSGSYTCSAQPGKGNKLESFAVTISGFTHAGPAGTFYAYTLSGHGINLTATSTGHSASLASGDLKSDNADTTWTLTLASRLGSWSSDRYTWSITCPAGTASSGTF